MRIERQLPGRSHRRNSHSFGDAAGLRQVRLHETDGAILDQAGELEAGVVVLAGRERRRAERRAGLVGTIVLRRERFFEPADPEFVIGRHYPAHVVDGVAGIGVDKDLDCLADRFAHGRGTGDIVARIVPDAQFDGLVAFGHVTERLLRQRRRRLVAERDAAGIGLDRFRSPAEQFIKRPARRLGADVP